MAWILFVGLAAGDAFSEAGTAYRGALEALASERYEEAVQLLRGALQHVGEESDELKYRDSVARRRHSYFPYYQWARARVLQARREASIYARRDLLQDAVGRLGQTRHPGAARLLEEAGSELEAVGKAITLDGSFNAVKTRIELLGSGERFVEALRQLESAAPSFPTRGKEVGELRESLAERQAAAVKRQEQLMAQRLAEAAATDPLAAGERVVALLRPALVPPDVTEKPGRGFEWLRAFIELWEKSEGAVRRAAELPGAEVIAAAGSLEAAGRSALDAGVPAGYRAARHLAQAARLAKLRDVAAAAQDAVDVPTAGAVSGAAGEEAAKAAAAVARADLAPEARSALEGDLEAQRQQVEDLVRKIGEAARERTRLTAPILQAEAALADGETIGQAAALAKVRNDLLELESEATFGTLTARLRARALFAHALAEAMLAFLEGNPPAQVLARCSLPARRAYGFDPAVDARWSGRLSPKMLKVLEQIKPQ